MLVQVQIKESIKASLAFVRGMHRWPKDSSHEMARKFFHLISSPWWVPSLIYALSVSSWWRHQMEKISASLALCTGNSPVTGEFLAQRPVTRSFDVFFDLRLNKRLSKQSWGWWFETPSCPLRRHCNVTVLYVLSWYARLRYNGSGLYISMHMQACYTCNLYGHVCARPVIFCHPKLLNAKHIRLPTFSSSLNMMEDKRFLGLWEKCCHHKNNFQIRISRKKRSNTFLMMLSISF